MAATRKLQGKKTEAPFHAASSDFSPPLIGPPRLCLFLGRERPRNDARKLVANIQRPTWSQQFFRDLYRYSG